MRAAVEALSQGQINRRSFDLVNEAVRRSPVEPQYEDKDTKGKVARVGIKLTMDGSEDLRYRFGGSTWPFGRHPSGIVHDVHPDISAFPNHKDEDYHVEFKSELTLPTGEKAIVKTAYILGKDGEVGDLYGGGIEIEGSSERPANHPETYDYVERHLWTIPPRANPAFEPAPERTSIGEIAA